jgi:hypothetical protein
MYSESKVEGLPPEPEDRSQSREKIQVCRKQAWCEWNICITYGPLPIFAVGGSWLLVGVEKVEKEARRRKWVKKFLFAMANLIVDWIVCALEENSRAGRAMARASSPHSPPEAAGSFSHQLCQAAQNWLLLVFVRSSVPGQLEEI